MKLAATFATLLYLSTQVVGQTPREPTIDDFLAVYNLISVQAQENRKLPRELVRLAFHDAWGVVDGHIDVRDREHDGVDTTFELLSTEYESFSLNSVLSKADFFAWSYIAGFYYTLPDEELVPWVPLEYGRTSFLGAIEDSPSEFAPPGSPQGGLSQTDTMQYFESKFGLNEINTTILMGAHTLGGARLGNSGFKGDWTRSENTFNAEYYEAIVDPRGGGNGWQQIAVESDLGGDAGMVTKYQWSHGRDDDDDDENDEADDSENGNRLRRMLQGGRGGFGGGGHRGDRGGRGRGGLRDLMLNVDMNLFFDLDPYMDEFGQVTLPQQPVEGAPDFCGTDGIVWAVCFPRRSVDDSESRVVVEYFGDEDIDSDEQIFVNSFATVYGSLLAHTDASTVLTEISKPAIWPPEGFETGGRNRRDGNNRDFGDRDSSSSDEGEIEDEDGEVDVDEVLDGPDETANVVGRSSSNALTSMAGTGSNGLNITIIAFLCLVIVVLLGLIAGRAVTQSRRVAQFDQDTNVVKPMSA